jgi:hypothetical protein
MIMSNPVIREINILENKCTVLVYADGIAIISPEESRIRTVWREKTGERRMHHVIEWEPLSDADFLRAIGIPVHNVYREADSTKVTD